MNFHPHFSLPVTLWQSTAHVEAKILDCISLHSSLPTDSSVPLHISMALGSPAYSTCRFDLDRVGVWMELEYSFLL